MGRRDARAAALALRRHGAQLVLLWLALFGTAGCMSLRPYAGAEDALAPNEGILVVHIHSAVPIQEIAIDGVPALANLEPGEHLRLLVVSAGSHRWTDVVVRAGEGEVPFRTFRSGEDWRFHVEAGRLNYIGEISFHGKSREKSVEIGYRMRNRSAQALWLLRERYPGLLERHRPTYAGSGRDAFLDFYATTFLGHGDAPALATP